MCGLVGFAGMLEHKHKLAMKDMFFLDTLRGKDSTGLSSVRRDRSVMTRKFAVPGYEFIEFPIVDKAMSFGDQVWIGHNRYRTTGDVNRMNAHPFEVLDENGDVLLVGAHNGTLDNKHELERKVGKFDTDSEALFNWFVQAPNYKDAVKELKGAWSLVFWDPTTDSLHFLRNDQRPLTFAYTKDHKAIVWASEPWMIINACRRNNVELEQNDKGLSCFSTLPDYLYTLEIPQERDKVLPEMKREGGYLGAPKVNFRGNFAAGFRHWWEDDDPNFEKEPKKAAEGTKETKADGKKDEKQIVTIGTPPAERPRIRGYNNKPLTPVEMQMIKEDGCKWCGEDISPKEACAFIGEMDAVCMNCLHDTHQKGGDAAPWEDDEPFPGDYQRLIDAAVTGRTTQERERAPRVDPSAPEWAQVDEQNRLKRLAENRAAINEVKKTVG